MPTNTHAYEAIGSLVGRSPTRSRRDIRKLNLTPPGALPGAIVRLLVALDAAVPRGGK